MSQTEDIVAQAELGDEYTVAEVVEKLDNAADSVYNAQEQLTTDVKAALQKLKDHENDPNAHGLNDPDSYINQTIDNAVKDAFKNLADDSIKEMVAEIVPEEVNKLLPAIIDDAVKSVVDKSVSDKIDELLPNAINNQLDDALNKKLPPLVSSQVDAALDTKLDGKLDEVLPDKVTDAISKELANPDSNLNNVLDASVSNIIQDKIENGELSGGGGGSGIVSIPMVDNLPLFISGTEPLVFTVSAKSNLIVPRSIDNFILSVPEANIDNLVIPATNNSAEITINLPGDLVVGSVINVSIIAVDSEGARSDPFRKAVTIQSEYVVTPVLTTPEENGESPIEAIVMITNDFSIAALSGEPAPDTHIASQFRIKDIHGNIVYDSGETIDLLRHTVKDNSKIVFDNNYYFEARHKGNRLGWSDYSKPVLALVVEYEQFSRSVEFLEGGSHTFTVPDGITQIKVLCIGGGGSGQGGGGPASRGCGGGVISALINVAPNQEIPVVVGSVQPTAGTVGTASKFGNYLIANGGAHNTANARGSTSSSLNTNDQIISNYSAVDLPSEEYKICQSFADMCNNNWQYDNYFEKGEDGKPSTNGSTIVNPGNEGEEGELITVLGTITYGKGGNGGKGASSTNMVLCGNGGAGGKGGGLGGTGGSGGDYTGNGTQGVNSPGKGSNGGNGGAKGGIGGKGGNINISATLKSGDGGNGGDGGLYGGNGGNGGESGDSKDLSTLEYLGNGGNGGNGGYGGNGGEGGRSGHNGGNQTSNACAGNGGNGGPGCVVVFY